MKVWLHTASPPQHISDVRETHIGPMRAYLAAVNKRRGLKSEFAGVFEDEHGGVSLHIFDTADRASVWRKCNYDQVLIISSED